MRKYLVTIGNSSSKQYASRASVAVHRAMDSFSDSYFRPVANIQVRDLGVVKFEHHLIRETRPKDGPVTRELVEVFSTDNAAWNARRTKYVSDAGRLIIVKKEVEASPTR
jgi:hypothetical protein